MQVIWLMLPCPSKCASASTFSTNDFIFITHLSSFLYLYCELQVFLSQIMFDGNMINMMSKLIKNMLNSLSGAGCLVFKKYVYNLNLTNIKCSNHVSKLT